MKRILLLILSVSFLFSLSACKGETALIIENCYTEKLTPADATTDFVQFELEGGATIVVQLLPEYAPQTVAHFKELVAAGFYDNLTFHRVWDGFIIQGGDPKGDGTGVADTTVVGEFADNGYEQNTLSHTRGIVSMARYSNDCNSASCQFFIVHDDSAAPAFDGKYAAFGRVVAGMETVDAIAKMPVHEQPYSREETRPITPPVIVSATFVNYTIAE